MVAMTKMAGPEEDMMAEQTYHELLNQVRKYQLDSSGLTLFDANNNELLFFSLIKAKCKIMSTLFLDYKSIYYTILPMQSKSFVYCIEYEGGIV